MKNILVTGSSGHLGEALMRRLTMMEGINAVGVDLKPSDYTTHVGNISDIDFVSSFMEKFDMVYHPCTLHKPHIVTHSMENFIDTNIIGTLNLLKESVNNDISSFVFTSTTSVFGESLTSPHPEPAVWVTEKTEPLAKNIYGVTKRAAEDLCRLFFRKHDLNCIILRTSRFFPEEDDDKEKRSEFHSDNLKVNEMLYRRVDIEDVVEAHLLASEKAPEIGFGKYIISSHTPFDQSDLQDLRFDVSEVLDQKLGHLNWRDIYDDLGWKMMDDIDRVYVSHAAMEDLGWRPKYTFEACLERISIGEDFRSPLTLEIGEKGYHSEEEFGDMKYYPV